MNPIYKFYVDCGNGYIEMNPNYSSDLSKEYNLETSQMFFRQSLSGKLKFIRNDYSLIYNVPFETEYKIRIEVSYDMGQNWSLYYSGKFMKTDCEFNIDDLSISVKPDILDQYSEVLAGIENEYDLIRLGVEIKPLLVDKRPIIQVYVLHDNIVSFFLGGTYWEQDSKTIDSDLSMINTYHFSFASFLKECRVTVNNSTFNDIDGLYTGSLNVINIAAFSGNLYADKEGYYIYFSQIDPLIVTGSATIEIRRSSDNVVMYRFSSNMSDYFDYSSFTLAPPAGSPATGTATVQTSTYRVYARYLTDSLTMRINNVIYPTSTIPNDDIVSNNRNYNRILGYEAPIAYISPRLSDTPTQWGLQNNGKYFLPPKTSDPSVQPYFPIARSRWAYSSIWFAFPANSTALETSGRTRYSLNDANPIYSIISVLLAQISPSIIHEPTIEYSQFLYSDVNPITGESFRIFSSPKSNALSSIYDQPAQKAPTTLQQFMTMLRDCFRCYWYIEENKFKIEHIEFFRNGGSYSGNPILSYDLTKLINVRNGKTWAYNTSKYSFDKLDMPERYEFSWMDDVSQAFDGYPIKVLSKYVSPGKKENINVSNFTSDIDYILSVPEDISKDGFALFAASYKNLLTFSALGVIFTDIDNGVGYINSSGDIQYSPNGDGMGYNYYRMRCSPNIRYILKDKNGNQINGVWWNYYDISMNSIERDGNTNGDIITPPGCYILGMSVRTSTNANPTTLPYIQLNNIGAIEEQEYSLVYETIQKNGVDLVLQNGIMSWMYLQPNFYPYDLPAKNVEINEYPAIAIGLSRKKKQEILFPSLYDPDPLLFIKTFIGIGQVQKLSVNLSSRMNKITLGYDTE